MAVNVRKINDGDVHWRVGAYIADLFLVSVLALCVLVFKMNLWLVLQKIGIVWIGLHLALTFATPDLDLHKSVPKRNWKGLGFIWEPYARFVAKKHRGTLSHGIEVPYKLRRSPIKSLLFKSFGFILGSIARTLYLLSIVAIIALVGCLVFGTTLFLEDLVRFVFSEVFAYLLIGVCLADAIHTRLDLLGNRKAL